MSIEREFNTEQMLEKPITFRIILHIEIIGKKYIQNLEWLDAQSISNGNIVERDKINATLLTKCFDSMNILLYTNYKIYCAAREKRHVINWGERKYIAIKVVTSSVFLLFFSTIVQSGE